MERHLLSKSSFIKSLQCPKQLYLYKNHYQLRDPLTEEQKIKFKRGHEVGKKAHDLFPGGVNCAPPTPFQYPQSVKKTQFEILKETTTIYEACFQYKRVLIALDILHLENGLWKAFEVKSSLAISETYILDASLQYWVIKGSGLKLNDFCIIHSTEEYNEKSATQLYDFFSSISVFDKIQERQDFINESIENALLVLQNRKIPEIEVGNQCLSPYKCDFWGYCHKNL